MNIRARLLKIHVFLILLGSWSLPLQSQQADEDGAFGGGNGIYVYLGPSMVSAENPWNEITHYKVFRSTPENEKWELLKEVEAPLELTEFRDRLDEALATVPYPIERETLPTELIWQDLNAADSLQEVWQWLTWLPVRLATGLYYYDPGVEPGVRYQYKIHYARKDNSLVDEFEYAPTWFPRKAAFPDILYRDKREAAKGIELIWEMESKANLAWVELQRQDVFGEEFREIPAEISFYAGEEKVAIYTQDPDAAQDHFYAYRAIPVDYFGNRGTPTETVKTGIYDYFQDITLPGNIRALSSQDPPGILIRWELQTNALVNGIGIYRSDAYEGEYRELATINPGFSTYLDQTAVPMKMYYYYLRLTGHNGEKSPPTSRFFGVWQSGRKPSPPQIRRSYLSDNQPVLEILSSDPETQGYRIYRRSHRDMEWQLISGLVSASTPAVIFTDTASTLDPAMYYDYAATAESKGYHESSLSPHVTLRPGDIVPVPMAMDFNAGLSERDVFLTWDMPSTSSRTVQGFLIYKRVIENGHGDAKEEYALLTPSLLPSHIHRYSDSTAQPGTSYSYAIEVMDIWGNTGEQATVDFRFPDTEVRIAPSLKAMHKYKSILLSWSPCHQEGIQNINLQRATAGQSFAHIAALSPGEACAYADTNVAKGTVYSYRLILETFKGKEIRSNRLTVHYQH
ncbi:MAG: hypothetical protein R6T99_11420 [Bacteroidales bacterium]